MHNRRWAVVALAGLWRRRASRARTSIRTSTRSCAPCPRRRCRTRAWLTLETPHFELHYYPDEQEFAIQSARVAERAYRLITRYLNWEPGGRISVVLTDQGDAANGGASSVPYNFIYAYGAPPDGMDELSDFDDFVKLLITHEFTHVVHLDTILSWCPRFVDSVLGQDLRAQPGAADLVHRGPGRADGDAADDGGAPAQHLLRHAPARALPRGTGAGPRRGLGRVRSARLPRRQRPLPLRFEPASLHGGSLRPREDPRDLAPIRATNASPAGSTAPRGPPSAGPTRTRSAPTSGTTGSAPRRTSTRCRSRRPSGAGSPRARRLTFDAPSPRGTLPRPIFFPDGTLIYQRENNDQEPAYVRLDPATGARDELMAAYGGGPGVADAGRTRVRVPARRLHPPRLAHLRQRSPAAGTTSTSTTSSAGRCGR